MNDSHSVLTVWQLPQARCGRGDRAWSKNDCQKKGVILPSLIGFVTYGSGYEACGVERSGWASQICGNIRAAGLESIENAASLPNSYLLITEGTGLRHTPLDLSAKPVCIQDRAASFKVTRREIRQRDGSCASQTLLGRFLVLPRMNEWLRRLTQHLKLLGIRILR